MSVAPLSGAAPLGWYTGRDSPNTRRLVVEHGGFLYDSDAYNDDLPYWLRVATSAGDRMQLVLPYAFDTNDMQFQHTPRFATGREFADYVCDAVDWLVREGASAPRMLSIGLHLRMVARPGRIGAVGNLGRVWENQNGVALFRRATGCRPRCWCATW